MRRVDAYSVVALEYNQMAFGFVVVLIAGVFV